MKLYLLSQDDNQDYDTYDSLVVCAESAEDAKTIAPNGRTYVEPTDHYSDWAIKSTAITVREIGIANEDQKRGVILGSFNAG